MRRPTPRAVLYAWHAAALAGSHPPVHDEAQPGWYKRKLVRGGPFVAVEIWMEQLVDDAGDLVAPEELRCEVDGSPADPHDLWTYVCDNPISQAEFRHMRSLAAWVKAHSPDEPVANPREPINLLRAPIPF